MTNSKKKHVKIGDKIQVISGSQKGIIGTITLIQTKKSVVYIDTISPRLKTVKNNKEGQAKRVELQIPIHISNVMLWDKEENKSSRIGYKIVDLKKRRYFKKSGNLV